MNRMEAIALSLYLLGIAGSLAVVAILAIRAITI